MVASKPRNPSLYQLNTRIWLNTLSEKYHQTITLQDIPDDELDFLVESGFDWIWLLGVWRTGELGQQLARQHPGLRSDYEQALPDLSENDICSSPFAITTYQVSPDLGGDEALERLRERLHERGLRLLLDFIPNHTARDHPWVSEHPEYYLQGTPGDLEQRPEKYGRDPQSERVFAFGRDPFFPGWTDTFQLNYGKAELQHAMIDQLIKVAGQCDGVRCDMAMLILPQVFAGTWGIQTEPFWPDAIQKVHDRYPEFLFMAEVYWDLEWHLQEQGFSYTYDKRLYDRLVAQDARPVREHLFAGVNFQRKSVRFLENHDEPRSAVTFPPQIHRAAAIITYLTPGMRFFLQGQLSGSRIRIPMQLCRAPSEPVDEDFQTFYYQLLRLIKLPLLRDGDWQLLECLPAWHGNWTWDNFIAFSWTNLDGERLLVITNYASHQGQAYLSLPFQEFSGHLVKLQDLLTGEVFERQGDDLVHNGLYLDLPAWGVHVFQVKF
jgi:glycosidase